MNQICVSWTRYPDNCISIVGAHGLSPDQLRHYAAQAGIRDLSNNPDRPSLIGTVEQLEDFFCVLECHRYDLDTEEITMPGVGQTEGAQ
jgi:hypothetical protein